MDGAKKVSISAPDIYRLTGTAAAPVVVIDVRRNASFAADNRMIAGAIRWDPGKVDSCRRLPIRGATVPLNRGTYGSV
jgi:hypothetical protein